VTPYETKKEISWSYPLPLNTKRHYLRTRLREKGVTGEIVDAFMGHWYTGQEPHGRFSTLSPQFFKQQIDAPLSTLLRDDGWVAIPGL